MLFLCHVSVITQGLKDLLLGCYHRNVQTVFFNSRKSDLEGRILPHVSSCVFCTLRSKLFYKHRHKPVTNAYSLCNLVYTRYQINSCYPIYCNHKPDSNTVFASEILEVYPWMTWKWLEIELGLLSIYEILLSHKTSQSAWEWLIKLFTF